MKRTPTVRLIVGRELSERLQGRLIWVLTAVMALGVVALIVIPPLLHHPSRPTRIGLVGAYAQRLRPALEATATASKTEIRLSDIPSDGAARSSLEQGSLDVALGITPESATAEVKHTLSPTVAALLRSTIDEVHFRQTLAAAGVSPSALRVALAPVAFSTHVLSPPPPDRAARGVAAISAAILLYLSLAFYASAVANGVAQEKTSRTAEVLLAAVRPRQLLTGKVVGIGLIGLGQIGIVVIAGLIANAAVKGVKIPNTIWLLLPSILLFFLLGYALYSFLSAAAGSMVARQEEVQFVTLPVLLPVIFGFFLVYAAIATPTAWWIRLLSFVPLFTPTLMPARIALGHVAGWEIPLAVLIMLASIYGAARLASRIYAGALVRSGARLSWRQALHLSGD